MATPSPTPFSTSKYDVSAGADGFHNLPGRDSDFDPGSSEYLGGVFGLAALPVILCVIFLWVYFIFLCVRNGCCSCCVNSWICCKGRLIWCLCCCDIFKCKATCCPAVEEHNKAKAHFPFFNKNADARCHNGCFSTRTERNWKKARAAILIVFFACFSINIGVMVGQASLVESFKTLADAFYDLADIFENIQNYAIDFSELGADMETNGNKLVSTCVYSWTDAVGVVLAAYGKSIYDVGIALDGALSNLPDKIDDLGDSTDNFGSRYMAFSSAGAALLLGTIFASLGMVAAMLPERRLVCCRFATNALACTSVIGIVTLFLLSITVMVELIIGQFVGDFCYDGPGKSLGELTIEHFNKTSPFFTKIVTHYTSCSGVNPFDSYYDDATKYAKLAADQIVSSQELIDRDGGCNDDAYSSISTSANLLYAKIDTNPLWNMYGEVGCSSLNPVFSKVLDDALCTHFIDGFYTLFSVHCTVLVFTYASMLLISFLRWDLQVLENHNSVGDGPPGSVAVAPVLGRKDDEGDVEMRPAEEAT